MKTTLSRSATTHLTPNKIFPKIAGERGAVWLDSSFRVKDKGRYSFIARKPKLEIVTKSTDFDSILSSLSGIWQNEKLFSAGFFSYESTLPFVGVRPSSSSEHFNPLVHFFVYDSALRFDHLTGEILATDSEADDYSDLFDDEQSDIDTTASTPKITPTVAKEEYLQSVRAIKRHIKEGDIYQANYTCRFDVASKLKPFAAYQNLRRLNPSPYSAYLNFGDYQVISSSPERMFTKVGNEISTGPIKGTIAAGQDELENVVQRTRLLDSAKDKAELLMIVDLMRNDLGRIAEIGSVKVNNLFSVEEYSSVIHLVSDISAKVKPDTGYKEIFSALLPGGSVTGAPKKRAVEILQTQESNPRGVYTGCIGYVHGQTADFNIAIRTMVHRDGTYHVHAGGGIVADSEPESEYREMQLKAKNLFRALGARID